MASGFADHEAIGFLEFDFPFECMIQQTVPPDNHRGAKDCTEVIDELVFHERLWVVGHIEMIWLQSTWWLPPVLPMNYVPKSETSGRSMILDLSFPPGSGVNDGKEKDMFRGETYKVFVFKRYLSTLYLQTEWVAGA